MQTASTHVTRSFHSRDLTFCPVHAWDCWGTSLWWIGGSEMTVFPGQTVRSNPPKNAKNPGKTRLTMVFGPLKSRGFLLKRIESMLKIAATHHTATRDEARRAHSALPALAAGARIALLGWFGILALHPEHPVSVSSRRA